MTKGKEAMSIRTNHHPMSKALLALAAMGSPPPRISEERISSFERPGFFEGRLFKALVAVAVVIAVLAMVAGPASASATFTVNSTADTGDATPDGSCDDGSGDCTLRAAIQEANAAANGIGGPDTIGFDIPGTGVQKIAPGSALPDIQDPVLIDGYTQPGASENTLAQGNDANLLIELDGTNAGSSVNGLVLDTSNSTVRGLVINRFSRNGIVIRSNRSGNEVEGNFIGTDATGKADLGNSRSGVYVEAPNNTIGGTSAGAGNVVSGNRSGVVLFSSDSKVQGNYLGTDATGQEALGNSSNGVMVQSAPNNTIGDTSAGRATLSLATTSE
jgi:CSLREA domain-containing protein